MEQKIDQRCTALMGTTTSSAQTGIDDLKKTVQSSLSSLKSRIGKIESKLEMEEDTVLKEQRQRESTEQQQQLSETIERLVVEKVEAIDFAEEIQSEVDNAEFMESNDPKLQAIETNIKTLNGQSKLHEANSTTMS